jgi:NADH-quinone oxidoreductase subunit N
MIPEVYLCSVVILLTLLGVFFGKSALSSGRKVVEVVLLMGVFGLLWGALLYGNQWGLNCYALDFQVKKDSLSLFFALLVTLATAAILWLGRDYVKKDSVDDFEYVLLVLLAVIGLLVMVTCNDLLVIYLGIELQSLCLYVLACLKRHSRYSTEAGLKYFILGAFSSCILLFGMSLFYGFTGITNLSDMEFLLCNYQGALLESKGFLLGLLLILIGLIFKAGGVPFHVWLPDVYAGSPTFVTSFFAVVPKIAVFGLMIKMGTVVSMVEGIDVLLLYSGLLSLLVGSLGGIYQTTIKRLIAYSAIGHTGFVLLALYVGGIDGTVAVCLYVLIYVFMLVNLFGIILSLRRQSDGGSVRLLGSLHEVYRSNGMVGMWLCLLLFSMAGIPPLAGFYSKLYVFFVMIKEELFFVSIIAVFLSVLGAVYYLRLIRILFFNASRKWGFYEEISRENSYGIVYSGLFIVLFCVYSMPILMGLNELVLMYYL